MIGLPHLRTHLDHDKTGPRRVRPSKIDTALIVGDIEALDAGLGDAGGDKE